MLRVVCLGVWRCVLFVGCCALGVECLTVGCWVLGIWVLDADLCVPSVRRYMLVAGCLLFHVVWLVLRVDLLVLNVDLYVDCCVLCVCV